MTKTKTNITAEEVRRLGELSRLNMSASEEAALREELSSIIGYFRVVDGVRMDVKIEKASEDPSSLRKDEVGPSDPEGVLKNVPQKKGRLVKAPRVF